MSSAPLRLSDAQLKKFKGELADAEGESGEERLET
jgi:hypothetical protein